jgi:hypothetical protein
MRDRQRSNQPERRQLRRRPASAWLLLIALAACGDDLYQPCDVAGDCTAPDGRDAACVDKEGEGFCSWSCASDADCDAEDDYSYVCAPFEENPGQYCFPSCDGDEECPTDYECRSTGGGAKQRRVCFPG